MRATKRTIFAALSATICIALALFALTGCSQQIQSQEEEPPATPSSYMVALNTYASDLEGILGEFSQAVSDDKLSLMQNKANEAYELIDKMKEIEAPESGDFDSIREEYMSAIDKLKTALADYIVLYTDVADIVDSSKFDYDAYASRLESIQMLYDEGLEELASADSKAQES